MPRLPARFAFALTLTLLLGLAPSSRAEWWDGFAVNGLDGPVFDVVEWRGGLVVTGNFDHAGSVEASDLAFFDGERWSALGEGLGGEDVLAPENHWGEVLHVHEGLLFVGGRFLSAGGVPATSIASYDGESFAPLGLGVEGRVYALASYANALYAGGDFERAGGGEATYVAQWNDGWSPVGMGLNAEVRALVVHEGGLFAGGLFDRVQQRTPASAIARWDGSAWIPVADGFQSGIATLPPVVFDLHVQAGVLHATGLFHRSGSVKTLGLARLVEGAWAPVGGGITVQGLAEAFGFALATHAGDLVVGGRFTHAGNTAASGIARFDGLVWRGFSSGTEAPVRALLDRPEGLYVAGDFLYAGGRPSLHLARWRQGGVGVWLERLSAAWVGVDARVEWSVEGEGTLTLLRAVGSAPAVALARVGSAGAHRDERAPAEGAEYWLATDRGQRLGPARLAARDGFDLALRVVPGIAPGPLVRFTLPRSGPACLDLHDARGRRVRRLWRGSHPAGEGELLVDFFDGRGRRLAAGVYHLRLVQDGRSASAKLWISR